MADQRLRYLKSEVVLIDRFIESAPEKDTPYFESLLRKRREILLEIKDQQRASWGGIKG